MPVSSAAPGAVPPTGAAHRDNHHRHQPAPHARHAGRLTDAPASTSSGSSGAGGASTIDPSYVIGGAWSFVGPQPITGFYNTSSGRVTSLAVDPTNAAVVYAGTAGGGVWKTSNSGGSWAPLTDSQASLSIGAVAVDPSNHLVVYAGTGEANTSIDSQAGAGILKSTDGGSTWATYGATPFAGHHIYAIAVDRTNSSRVLVASSIGLYISTDGGLTYTLNNSLFNLSPNTGGYLPRVDVLIQDPDPNHANSWYAAVDERCVESGFIGLSTDGGVTWTQGIRPTSSISGLPKIARFGMAEGPGGVLYAELAACGDTNLKFAFGQLAGLLKSTDFAGTWTLKTSMSDLFTSGGNAQGWYDITVAVDPVNANRAVFGGITLLTTTDGGATFTDVAKPYNGGPVHPDFHAIAFTAANAFYAGNDGGVWRTADLGGAGGSADWTNLNSTLGITTFYGGTAIDATHLIGGTQDNGTSGLLAGGAAPPAWSLLEGGDGGYAAMAGPGSNYYGEQAMGALFRADYTKPGALTAAGPCSASGSDPACAEPSAQATPFVVDPANPSIVFTAGTHLYRTTSGGVPAGVGGWAQISGDLTSGNTLLVEGDYVSAMAISADGSVLALGTETGRLWFVSNPATNPSFTDATSQLPAFDANKFTGDPWVSGIALPQCTGLPCVAYVSLGAGGVGRVWAISSSGANPNNITNNLDTLVPNAVVTSVLWTTDGTTAGLYVGTDSGVFACYPCGNGATSWLAIGTGLPNARVDQLTLTPDGGNVIAWTHGRGAWKLPRVAGQILSATSVDFAGITIGETSAAQHVNVKNSGLLSSQINSVTITGPNAADFTLTNQWNCVFGGITSGPPPIPMPPGTTCQVNVTFSPTTASPESATLTVTNSLLAAVTVALTGSPLAPAVSLSTTNMTYLTTTVGTTNSLNQGRITVTNNAGGNLDVKGYQISGPNAGDFSYTDDTCTGRAIAKGQTCYVDVPFKPVAAGTRMGTFAIIDNATDSPQTVALSGVATQPTVSVIPASLAFGAQATGTTSAGLNVAITNNGPGDFLMTGSGFPNYGASITGTNAADFSWSIGTCSATIPQGSTCTLTVQFSPRAGSATNRSATLNITDNAAGSPQQVPLSGVVGAAAVTLSPTSIAFGNQPAGTTSAGQMITIQNSGSSDLVISGAYTVSPTPTFSILPGAGTCTAVPLPAGASCTIAVQFSPTAAGSYSGTFTMADGSGSTATAMLTGTGTSPAIQVPGAVQFGNVLWSQPASQAVTITNVGTGTLVLGSLSIAGSTGTAADFAIPAAQDSCSGRSVSPGATCTVTVVFTPHTITFPASLEQAQLQIPSNVPNHAATMLPLSGTGVAAALSLSPSSPAFATVPTGSSASITMTVSNAVPGASGTAPLEVSGITFSGPGAADFAVTSQTCVGMQVAPGAGCTITVAFTPTAVGARSARLSLASNAYPACCTAYADITGTGGWDGRWQSLDGVLHLSSGPAFASSGANTTNVFVRGTDNQLWTRSWNGSTWTGWTSLGGVLISDPTAVSQDPNSIDVFVIGTDHGIWHRQWNGTTWSPWENSPGAGGYATSSPEVASWGPGRLDLVVRGTDSQLWHRSWNGTSWSAWDAAGGIATSDPGLVASGSGRIDVFVRGTDNALWHRQGNGAGSWGPWESLGGTLTSGPDAASCSPGHLDVFLLGTGGVLWQRSYNGITWSSWQRLGGSWTSGPGAVCRPGTVMVDLGERGADGVPWHTVVPGT